MDIPMDKMTLKRGGSMLLHLVENLSPLIVFIVLNWLYGIEIALAGSIAVAALDVARRYWFNVEFNRMIIFANGMTIGFGLIDLFAESPFMLRFEPVISNFVIGVVFGASAFGGKSMIQEFVEKRRGEPLKGRPDLVRFFQLFTWVWVAYFVLKAGFYLWLGLVFPLDTSIEIRTVFGPVTLGLMLLLSFTQGKRLYHLGQRIGLVPKEP